MDGQVLCHVRDNGIGTDPQFHDRVFHLFHRLDPDSKSNGIARAIVKGIVEFHGGWAWVESEGPGHGSAFRFTLPAGGAGVPGTGLEPACPEDGGS
jgi:two-component system sensor kinase FixL